LEIKRERRSRYGKEKIKIKRVFGVWEKKKKLEE